MKTNDVFVSVVLKCKAVDVKRQGTFIGMNRQKRILKLSSLISYYLISYLGDISITLFRKMLSSKVCCIRDSALLQNSLN